MKYEEAGPTWCDLNSHVEKDPHCEPWGRASKWWLPHEGLMGLVTVSYFVLLWSEYPAEATQRNVHFVLEFQKV